MFQLCFCKNFPFPYLAPIACHYLHHPDGFETTAIDHPTLERFIQTCKVDEYIPVVQNIRVPKLDAPPEVSNRYALSSMVILKMNHTLTKKDFWRYMAYNRQALDMLKTLCVDDHVVNYIEQCIWSSIPTYWKGYANRFINRFINAWSIEAYEVYYSPDYVWKSGPKKGFTTIEILSKRWNDNHMKDDQEQ